MNCTNLQQFITTNPRKRNWTQQECTDVRSQDTAFFLGKLRFFLSIFFVLYVNKKKKMRKKIQKMKKRGKKKQKQRIRLYLQIVETNIFLPKQLWSLPALPLQMASLVKNVTHVKRWNTKMRNMKKKTFQDSNYWHFPCVMVCTPPFVVRLQYIPQYVKHIKCETDWWRYWQQKRCSLPVSYFNMHNFFHKEYYL